MTPLVCGLLALASFFGVCAGHPWRGRGRLVWVFPFVFIGLALLVSGPFIAAKAVARLVMPPGLIWFGGILGIGWLLAHGRRLGFALTLWIGYSLAGNTWVGGAMLGALEAPYRAPPTIAEPLDATLVLGGGTSVRPDGTPQLGHSGDRVATGARLFIAGKTRTLITCGTSVAGLQQASSRSLAEETKRIWTELGVPAEAVIMVPGPRNTREEISALARLTQEHGWERVGLVTSAWHLRRAMARAEAHGLELVPIGSDFRGEVPTPSLVGLIPSGNGFYRVRKAAWEYLGRALGK